MTCGASRCWAAAAAPGDPVDQAAAATKMKGKRRGEKIKDEIKEEKVVVIEMFVEEKEEVNKKIDVKRKRKRKRRSRKIRGKNDCGEREARGGEEEEKMKFSLENIAKENMKGKKRENEVEKTLHQ